MEKSSIKNNQNTCPSKAHTTTLVKGVEPTMRRKYLYTIRQVCNFVDQNTDLDDGVLSWVKTNSCCKAPVTPNSDATAHQQHSENISEHCGFYKICLKVFTVRTLCEHHVNAVGTLWGCCVCPLLRIRNILTVSLRHPRDVCTASLRIHDALMVNRKLPLCAHGAVDAVGAL